jgi:hypothetical protein
LTRASAADPASSAAKPSSDKKSTASARTSESSSTTRIFGIKKLSIVAIRLTTSAARLLVEARYAPRGGAFYPALAGHFPRPMPLSFGRGIPARATLFPATGDQKIAGGGEPTAGGCIGIATGHSHPPKPPVLGRPPSGRSRFCRLRPNFLPGFARYGARCNRRVNSCSMTSRPTATCAPVPRAPMQVLTPVLGRNSSRALLSVAFEEQRLARDRRHHGGLKRL